MDAGDLIFMPWTKALHAAGARADIRNARGYWGVAEGDGGRVVCSVWSDHLEGDAARASIPRINKGGYRDAASALVPGDEVIAIIRSRETEQGAVHPHLWRVDRVDLSSTHANNVGWLILSRTDNPIV